MTVHILPATRKALGDKPGEVLDAHFGGSNAKLSSSKRKRGRPPAGRPHNLARVNAEAHAQLERIAARLGITQAEAIEHAARVASLLLFPALTKPKAAQTPKTRKL